MRVELKHPNYFSLGEFHICQFCGEPIRNSVTGRFSLLHNFGQAQYHISKNDTMAKYIITGCKECLKRIKEQDNDLLQQVYDNDPATQEGYTVETPSNYKVLT